eukprot:1257000-Pyramimonas_sp.AAC.1
MRLPAQNKSTEQRRSLHCDASSMASSRVACRLGAPQETTAPTAPALGAPAFAAAQLRYGREGQLLALILALLDTRLPS